MIFPSHGGWSHGQCLSALVTDCLVKDIAQVVEALNLPRVWPFNCSLL